MPAECVAIVGAGPAGLEVARAYREHGGDRDVTLIGQEPLAPYERPPLTKQLLRGELDAAELALEDPRWFAAHDVALRSGERATAIDPIHGIVQLAGGEQVPADAIVLACGSEPVRPELPGVRDPRVMTMRTLDDALALDERAHQGGRVIVIGTGFIGCEIAGSLALRGGSVTLVGEEALPQVERLGNDAAARIAGWLRRSASSSPVGRECAASRTGGSSSSTMEPICRVPPSCSARARVHAASSRAKPGCA